MDRIPILKLGHALLVTIQWTCTTSWRSRWKKI
jgi:hypothetical protein